MPPKIIAETDRLQLCHFVLDDAPFALELLNEPSWIQFIGDRGVRTLAQAEAYIQDSLIASYTANGYGLYLVQRTADGMKLGMCGLVNRPSLPHVDIGFAYLPQFTGQGVAFEAATAVLHHAHHELNLSPIVAITNQDNHRSIKLLKKLGMRFQKLIPLYENEPDVCFFSE